MIGKLTLGSWLLTLFFLGVFACKPKAPKASNPDKLKIDSLESELKSDVEKSPATPNLDLAMHLAQAYQNYAVRYPEDSLSAGYFFKAGQIIENVFNDKSRAAEIYYEVYRKYPKNSVAPYALFMTGNLFHSIRDTTHAAEMLQFFLAKYPDHELKADAKALLLSFGIEPDTTSAPVKDLPMNPN